MRTCIGCKEIQAKRSLIRIVHGPQGVEVDLTGKKAGRGTYLHSNPECWEKALKASLAQALKTEITAEERARLLEFMKTLQARI